MMRIDRKGFQYKQKSDLLNQKGFTLVEIVVVLAIVAILTAVTVPNFASYVEEAQKTGALMECRTAVTAAQSLYIENFDNPDAVTIGAIQSLANVSGTISGVEADQGMLLHLTYTTSKWTVNYCSDPDACGSHSEQYTISKDGGGGGNGDGNGNGDGGGSSNPPTEDPEEPQLPVSTEDYFYIAEDENYKVSTMGDLSTYDFGPYGQLIPTGSVYYWMGEYYLIKEAPYVRNEDNRAQFISNKGVKMDTSRFKTPSASTAPGDLKLENGRVYVFFPYSRFQGDYADPNYWLEVTVD